jgi:hypothetical protein
MARQDSNAGAPRRPLWLVSRSDTHLSGCTEMHSQPRVPKVPVFTAYRHTKLCGQHTADELPDIKRQNNTRTRTGACVSNLSRGSRRLGSSGMTPCTLFTDVSVQPAGSIIYCPSTNKCHTWSSFHLPVVMHLVVHHGDGYLSNGYSSPVIGVNTSNLIFSKVGCG